MFRSSLTRSPLLAGLLAILLLAASTVLDAAWADHSAPADAATWELGAENDLLSRHNAHRVANGLQPLVRDPALDAIAREWTAQMAASEALSHSTNLREMVESRVTTSWQRIGENVGWGPSTSWLHAAFVASAGHNANILGDYNRVGVGAALDDDGDLWVTVTFLEGPALDPVPAIPPTEPVDAWVVDSTGAVATIGSAPHYGDLRGVALNHPIVGMAPTPTGNGYWLVATDGGIFAYGDATFHGSTGNIHLNQPIVGMAPTPTGNGYWLVATDGGIFAYGDATFHGSTGNIHLNQPIVGMAPTPTGNGYWLVATDGGIFAYGDATFHGSTGNIHLNQPIVGMAPTPTGNGYWLVATDGGIFAYGDATFHGAPPGMGLSLDVVAMAAVDRSVSADSTRPQYWMFDRAGRALGFGAGDDGLAGTASNIGAVVSGTVR